MKITRTPEIPDVLLIEPTVRPDPRGFFLQTYHQQEYADQGLGAVFVQDNQSRSAHGTLRGLHAQVKKPQGKLVHAIVGEIWDVAVDLRPGSPTYKRWVARTLSEENHHQLYVPPGFLHGFVVLSPTAHVEYKVTRLYNPGDELTIAWNDPEIQIRWPLAEADLLLNDRDRTAPRLAAALHRLEVWKLMQL